MGTDIYLTLPPPEQWYSKLKSCELGKTQQDIVDNYDKMNEVWRQNNMKTLADFLQWYNNLDVTLMVDACDTLCKQYNDKGIDRFKQALSSPGISLVLGMREAEEAGYRIPLVNNQNKNFHYKVNHSIVGVEFLTYMNQHREIRDLSLKANYLRIMKSIIISIILIDRPFLCPVYLSLSGLIQP